MYCFVVNKDIISACVVLISSFKVLLMTPHINIYLSVTHEGKSQYTDSRVRTWIHLKCYASIPSDVRNNNKHNEV